MTIRRVRFGAVVLMGLMLMPLAAYSDDAADVLATEDRAIELFNAGDADGLAPMLAENFSTYPAAAPLVVGREAFLQGVAEVPTSNESFQIVALADRQVSINGRTAVAAGIWGNFWKPVDGPAQSTFFNSVSTYVKIGNEWKLAFNMTRTLPHGSVP